MGTAQYPHDRRLACERIAREAGELLHSRFGDPGEVRAKGDPAVVYDVVTEVDELSERLVLGRIAELNPEAVVLAEEGGLTDVDGIRLDVPISEVDELWIVDPLDGTINFAHGIPHFAVSIACWRRGVPVAGAICDPMVGELFSFQRADDGVASAFHDGVPIRMLDPAQPGDALVYLGTSASLVPELVAQFRGTRKLASAALALAWVAAGRCGAYVQLGRLQPWDWAAGAPLVQAAGGIVTDQHARRWPSPLTSSTGVFAAAPTIHAQVSEIVAAASATW